MNGSERRGPVPRAALDDLLGALPACLGAPLSLEGLVDFEVACQEARRFKLDVSFAITPDARRSARFSVNDKGEPVAFRSRLLAAAGLLGVPPTAMRAQFAASPPGEAQTTLGVKWDPGSPIPGRVSVYFEELMRCPRALAVREATFAAIGARPPDPPAGLQAAAVCVDYVRGAAESVKDYWMLTEREDTAPAPLGERLDAFRARFGFHPANHTRRFLFATRTGRGGGARGEKLIWMSEVQREPEVDWAWAVADRLRSGLGGPVGDALDDLRRRWRHAPATFLYPDLVSLNVDARGDREGVIVYVSIR